MIIFLVNLDLIFLACPAFSSQQKLVDIYYTELIAKNTKIKINDNQYF